MNELIWLFLIPIGIAILLILIWVIAFKLKLSRVSKFIERLIDDVLSYPF